MTAPAPPRHGDRRLTLAVLALALVVLLPTLTFRLGVDQGVFAFLGEGILHGRWPYLSAWEGDYPGMMVLHALEILAFGKSIVMFRVFDIAVQLVAAYLIFRLAAWMGSRGGGVLAVGLYCLTYQGYGPWNTAQREGFATPLVLWGYWLHATRERRPAPRTALLIGLGLGLAVMIKPTMLALAAFYLPLVPAIRPRHWRLIAAAAAGLLLPAGLVVGFYAAVGGLRELYEATVAYQAVYTARLRGTDPLLLHWLANLARVGWQTLGLGLAFLPLLRPTEHRRQRAMLYLGYLGAIAAVVVQGTFAGYHYLPGLAIGAVMVGCGFAAVIAWGRHRFPVLARQELGLASALVLCLAPVYLHAAPIRRLVAGTFLRAPVAGEFRIGTVFDFTESSELAAYLQRHTTAADRIQIWGYEPLVYYLADRWPASRFHITHPLVMRDRDGHLTAMQQRWRREFLDSIAARPPRYVVVVRQDNWWWAPGTRTSEQLLDDFPAWKRYLARHYHPERSIGRFDLYRLTDPGEG